MDFNMWFPVRIISGTGCVEKNASLFRLGKHAFIVCGSYGAAASGALDGVTSALTSLGIAYTVFNKSTENPPVLMCYEGGMLCRECGADFVIGIGGGSALDAAKAVAVFAADSSLSPLDIFDNVKRTVSPLPLIAVPTTSGTGSEANGTSVMSLPDGKRKQSFATEFPRVAFLDPRYTYSLSAKASMSCALDAFAHSCESYLSPKSTPVSRMLAAYAAKGVWSVIRSSPDEFTSDARQTLQNSATAAGLAISVTGTGFPHPLGYSLTMLDGVSHGNACAVFYRHYIEYNLKTTTGAALLREFCQLIGTDASTLAEAIPLLSEVRLTMTENEISTHIGLVKGAKNYMNSPYVLSDAEKLSVYRELFKE